MIKQLKMFKYLILASLFIVQYVLALRLFNSWFLIFNFNVFIGLSNVKI